MAWPSAQSTTNLDAGTDSLALARPDLKNLVDAFNTILAYRGVTDGFTATDSTGRQVLGTNFTAGIESGNAIIRFDTGDYWTFNRTTNALDVYKDSALICSIPFATFNSVANLTGWAGILGSGIGYESSKLYWKPTIAQVTKVDTQTLNSASWTDISGLSYSISPSSLSAKVSIKFSIPVCEVDGASIRYGISVFRGSTNLASPSSPGSRNPAFVIGDKYESGRAQVLTQSYDIIDSPGTTSSTTYSVKAYVTSGSIYVNRGNDDTNSSSYFRGVSTLTVTEIPA